MQNIIFIISILLLNSINHFVTELEGITTKEYLSEGPKNENLDSVLNLNSA